MSWTNERITLLKKLWGEGKTAAEIAKELGGVTRNAVIGKAHRLNLSNRASPIKPISAKKPANSQEEPAKQTSSVRNSAPVKARRSSDKNKAGKHADEISLNGVGVSMAELKEKMCRWPIGDPRESEFYFCGHSSMMGLPYCAEHSKIAYQAVSRSRVLKAADFEEKPAARTAIEEEDSLQDSVAAA